MTDEGTDRRAPDPATPAAWVEAWGPTSAEKSYGLTVDVHAHMMVPASAEMTRPHLKPEFEPRTFFSSPVTKEVNAEFYRLAQDKYTDVDSLAARFGADHLLIGTDYPFDMGETDPLALLAASGLDLPDRQLVAGENARRLFSL